MAWRRSAAARLRRSGGCRFKLSLVRPHGLVGSIPTDSPGTAHLPTLAHDARRRTPAGPAISASGMSSVVGGSTYYVLRSWRVGGRGGGEGWGNVLTRDTLSATGDEMRDSRRVEGGCVSAPSEQDPRRRRPGNEKLGQRDTARCRPWSPPSVAADVGRCVSPAKDSA